MNNESGFTLIETVASLVIVAVLAAFAGMSIVTGTKGYVQTRENSHLAQKAQVTMARVYRELMELTNIAAVDTSSEPWIIFDNPQGRQAIAKEGDTLRLYTLGLTDTNLTGEGDLLADQVAGFSLNYFQGPNAWTIADEIELLSAVQVSVDLQRKEGSRSVLNFTTTVYPRNNNNFGGAPTTDALPATMREYDCFVTAAAAGKSVTDSMQPVRWHANITHNLPVLILLALTAFMTGIIKRIKESEGSIKDWMTRIIILHNKTGNVLVGLVVTMLVFSVLGAGMLSLTSTSSTSQVAANNAARAYYIAESGFRYAASEFLHTSDTGTVGLEDDRNRKLKTLHDNGYYNLGDDGKFKLEMYPFFLTTGNDSGDATILNTKFSGSKPASLLILEDGMSNDMKLKIGENFYTYANYFPASGQFTGVAPDLETPISADATVKLVAVTFGGPTIVKDGDLVLDLDPATGNIFPEFQGKF
mgnify:CR=1 FL=1